MADDDQKQVEIEVALRDTASQTLRGISREIDNITRKLVETGRRGSEALEGIKRKGGEAGQGSEKAAHGVDQFTKSITGLTNSLKGPLGLAAAFYFVGKSLTGFAQHQSQLSLLTADLGLTVEKMERTKQILMRKGLSEDAAKGFITGIAGQLQDLRVRDVYSDFYRRLAIYGDSELTESLRKSVKSGNITGAFDQIIEHVQKKTAEGKGVRARYFAQNVVGQKPSDFTDWDEMSKNLVKNFHADEDEVKRTQKEGADLAVQAENITNRFIDNIIHMLHKLDKAYDDTKAPIKVPAPSTPSTSGSPAVPPVDYRFGKWSDGPGGSKPEGSAQPEILVPGNLGPRSDLGTSGATDFSSSNRRRGVASTLQEIEPVEKETNRTLISIRDVLNAVYGNNPLKMASLGGSPTSSGGQTTPGGGGGGGGGGGDTPGAIGALGGMVHGHQVDAFGGLTGKTLFDPMTAQSLGGGLGGHSAKFGPGHHEGLDIMGPQMSKVHAIQDGVVIRAPHKGGGNDQVMIIQHPDGTYTRYLHQSWSANTVVSGKVSGGQIVGSSGHRNADHSHVEMWVGPPGRGKLINLRAVMGYGKKNLPVGGTPRTGRGPSDYAAPPAAPAPSSGRSDTGGDTRGKTPFQIFRDAAAAAGIKDPDTAAAIAMFESGGMKRGNRSVFDKSGGTNPFGQTVPKGTPGAVLGRDGQWHATYGSLQEAFEFHKGRWGDAYGDTPAETLRNMRRRGYNKENPAWQSQIEAIRRREMLDRANKGTGPQASRRDGRVKATVDFGAMAKVKEAGEIFMPIRTASFSQGSTVHRTSALPGSSDYSRWTA